MSEEDEKKKKEDAQLSALAGFLHETYSDSIHSILLDDDPSKLHFPLVIECVLLPTRSSRPPPPNPNPISSRRFAKLMDFDPEFAGKLYSCPGEYLPFLDKAAKRVKVSEPAGRTSTSYCMPIPHSIRKPPPCRMRCSRNWVI